MKNTQKILIAVLVLTLVIVAILVFFAKTNNNASSSGNPDYHQTLPDNVATLSDSDTTHLHHNEENGNITSVTGKDNHNENKTNITDNNNFSTNSNKTYNFKDSEVLLKQKSYLGDIKILSARVNNKKVFLLESTVKNKKFYYEFPGYYNIENIYYADIDGYFGDEVIIHANTGGNGGAGSYDNFILKITEDGIISLLDEKNIFNFLSSFSSELKENFNVEITNKYTGFRKTINVKDLNDENYADSYWESTGELVVTKTHDEVWIDETFYVFEPRDTDNDGCYEVVCLQYASLGAHASCIGTASITLKYDRESKQFSITDADFYLPSK